MKRRKLTAAFKAKVALAAIKNDKTISELSSEFQVHANQVRQWKKQLLDNSTLAFTDGRSKTTSQDDQALRDRLYQQIGQLQVELDWVKKKSNIFE